MLAPDFTTISRKSPVIFFILLHALGNSNSNFPLLTINICFQYSHPIIVPNVYIQFRFVPWRESIKVILRLHIALG
ncbi:hypothetical protein CC78DRAFT_599781 [Lojkania enalia]|uniref:Uncharacterized protein n=1 Tax=Lojkania enalia TaxID=147567 RepID=A0A9P4N490_9PLEO|nr:hypothetical protein CC78DRAFT_599781 [Didymosphaeria enalia]